ncbi:hypothetical protein QCA50_009653 [Cerrena zonata]|uniref:Uncharacterized protein n=1 Tax=Cerrena zonata TaxID=2478898 RepID=A0AAW0G107_9APHY
MWNLPCIWQLDLSRSATSLGGFPLVRFIEFSIVGRWNSMYIELVLGVLRSITRGPSIKFNSNTLELRERPTSLTSTHTVVMWWLSPLVTWPTHRPPNPPDLFPIPYRVTHSQPI